MPASCCWRHLRAAVINSIVIGALSYCITHEDCIEKLLIYHIAERIFLDCFCIDCCYQLFHFIQCRNHFPLCLERHRIISDIINCNFIVDSYLVRSFLRSEFLMRHMQNIVGLIACVKISYCHFIIGVCSHHHQHMNSDLAQAVLLWLKSQELVELMAHWAMASASSREE